MVAFLSKSDASAGFDEIVHFLNAQVIQYALIVNPTIYVSCIKQFWAMVSIKKANDVVKLRALYDGKRVVVTEDVIRQYLHLDDADGIECLPNEEIFTELALMGYEKPLPMQRGQRGTNLVVQWRQLLSTLLQRKKMKLKYLMHLHIHLLQLHLYHLKREPITTPPQAQPAPPSSPPQEPPTTTSESSMTLLNNLIETCATLSQKVAALEQDKIAQALEIFKLKRRVKKLEKHKREKSSGGCIQTREIIEAIDANEDVTLVDAETQVDLGAKLQGSKDEDNAATKDASAAEPTVFDDEEMAKRLHDEEVEQATAREKQEKYDLQKAKVLQQQYVDKQENIDWNVVVEQMQEKYLDNIRKYQSLKRKAISIAQARKNMIVYLKNMVGYKMEHFKGMTYDKVRPIFEREYNKVQTLFKPDKDVEEPQKKRVAEETLVHESFKILKAVEVSISEFKVEALQSFEDMLKGFNREDLDALWGLVKEKFNTTVPTVDNEKALWVELKRLFELDTKDVLWKIQRYMHYPLTWKLHSNCRVHQVSSTMRRHNMFMLTEKNYLLSNGVMTLMLSAKLQVKEDSDMARDLVMKIFMEANKPKSKSFDTSSK
nr:hypothetical protein [Tanacetum cinerariifolium]